MLPWAAMIAAPKVTPMQIESLENIFPEILYVKYIRCVILRSWDPRNFFRWCSDEV